MKKPLSILFAVLILLSGTHLTFATHICGGEVAGTKWSFTNEKASCGMEIPGEAKSRTVSITSACCHDFVSNYKVDNTYKTSSTRLDEPVNLLFAVYLIPENIGLISLITNQTVNTDVRPPGKFIAAAVSLPDICVFRI